MSSTGASGSYAIKWLKDHLPHCQFDNGATTDYVNCFKDIEKISCKDIKDIVSHVKDSSDESKFLDIAKKFNDNKDVIEEGVRALTHTLNNTKCLLNEVNKQILTGKDDVKFDLHEVDDLRNIFVQNLGGVTRSHYNNMLMIMLVLLFIMIVIIIIGAMKM
jgi:hypothetical protein